MIAAFRFGPLGMIVRHPKSGVDLLAPVRVSDISDELGPTFIVEPLKFCRVGRNNGKACVGRPVLGVPV